MNILRNTTDVYKPYRHVPWCSLCMFIKGVLDACLHTRQYHEYSWTSFQHFKVPVFREIPPPSEQNIMIQTPFPPIKCWMNISIYAIFKSKSHSLKYLVQNYTDNIFILRVVLLTVKDSTSELIIASIVGSIKSKILRQKRWF